MQSYEAYGAHGLLSTEPVGRTKTLSNGRVEITCDRTLRVRAITDRLKRGPCGPGFEQRKKGDKGSRNPIFFVWENPAPLGQD